MVDGKVEIENNFVDSWVAFMIGAVALYGNIKRSFFWVS